MTKDEILKLLENEPAPISKIEADLGMPKTTLQKAAKGERVLPKKWAIALKAKYSPKIQVLPQSDKTINPTTDKAKVRSGSINTGKPERLDGEDALEYAFRVNEWKRQQNQ